MDFDSHIAQNTLFPGTPKDLGYLSSLYCRYHWYWKDDAKDWSTLGDMKLLLDYNCLDVLRQFECATVLRELIPALGQVPQWELKREIHHLCCRMMYRGVAVDHQRRRSVHRELMAEHARVCRELDEIIPPSLLSPANASATPKAAKPPTKWYNSSQKTNHLFYEVLGLKRMLHRKTGATTGGKEAIGELIKAHPELVGLFDRILLRRSLANTANVISAPVDPDNRIRCEFKPAGTETHRLSSSKNAFGRGLNLQNITKGEED
jgi:hypothetical protein